MTTNSADAFSRCLKPGKLVLVLLALGALAACGSSGHKTAYVVGLGSPRVVAYQVSGAGSLTKPVIIDAGAGPAAIVVEPKKRFAYVADSAPGAAAGGISQYTVNASSGALAAVLEPSGTTGTTVVAPPVPTGANPVALAVDSRGAFLFVANKNSNSISAFSIDQKTGILTAVTGSPFATAAGPSSLAISSNVLFVANQAAGGVSAYTFDANSGALTPVSGSPFAAGTSPTGLDVAGNFLYVADQAANAVVAFSVGSGGALTPLSGSPFPAGTAPVSVRAHRSGKFVYVANAGSNDVSVFAVGSSGALTAVTGSPFAAGTGPSFLITDTDGKLLFVANAGSTDLSVFDISGTNGGLAPVAGSPVALDVGLPSGVASIN